MPDGPHKNAILEAQAKAQAALTAYLEQVILVF